MSTPSVLDRPPKALMEPIHDRMPVILEPEDERRWLEEDDQDQLQSMLDPYGDGLEAYPISTAVNNPKNDSADVLLPIDGPDQSGLGDFD